MPAAFRHGHASAAARNSPCCCPFACPRRRSSASLAPATGTLKHSIRRERDVINRYTSSATAAAAALILTACALRLGGPSPELYNTVALSVASSASASDVASALSAGGAEIVLLAAEQDSTWFASVATGAGLSLSGPGRTSGRGMAF